MHFVPLELDKGFTWGIFLGVMILDLHPELHGPVSRPVGHVAIAFDLVCVTRTMSRVIDLVD